jgi:hypothetical protein
MDGYIYLQQTLWVNFCALNYMHACMHACMYTYMHQHHPPSTYHNFTPKLNRLTSRYKNHSASYKQHGHPSNPTQSIVIHTCDPLLFPRPLPYSLVRNLHIIGIGIVSLFHNLIHIARREDIPPIFQSNFIRRPAPFWPRLLPIQQIPQRFPWPIH